MVGETLIILFVLLIRLSFTNSGQELSNDKHIRGQLDLEGENLPVGKFKKMKIFSHKGSEPKISSYLLAPL